ncbi:hypothetical protein GCM10009677_57600 [Sphaerisporangium rubeum]|uniref:Uncharacterized protein n=1 Tax=Sphaerisporangium rubeum TaxID=321317 RepID=A0A7X0IFY8_9ACTN|nr:hypothetical protein [Sphaerisporangium rubeum]MBB6474325.1 hypothetical protein [Sphaerisporangium rubeum]
MGRKAFIDRVELRRLVAAGWSNAEIAARFGVTESGVSQAKRAAGLARAMLDHGRAIPWKLSRVHNQTGPATNLRNLSAVAQGGEVPRVKVNTAVRWARRLVEAGMDVAYDPEKGFYEMPVSGSSHVGSVLNDALAALERQEAEAGESSS